VLTPRQWSLENLVQMLSGLFLCLAGGMITHQLMVPPAVAATSGGKLVAAVIHSAFFHVGGFICVARLLSAERVGWSEGFGLSRNRRQAITRGLLAVVVVTPVMMLLQGVLARWLTPDGEAPAVQEMVKTIGQAVAPDQLLFYGLMAIVLAPVIEELLFRGIFYPAIKSRGHPRLALWGTSLMFGVVHSNRLTLLPLTLLALVLVWLYERTGNLLAPIIAHSGFNAINFLLLMGREPLLRMLPEGY